MVDAMTDAPERILAHDAEPSECEYIGAGWWDEVGGTTIHDHMVEYVRADLAKPRVKPLVWYDKPEGQEQRIGRCGRTSYGVRFKMGLWGYQRSGERGHVVSHFGGALFKDEADAMLGANNDHERRILEALE